MKFKAFIKIIILFCLLCPFLNAENDLQQVFLDANRLYKEGEFEKAYKLYEKIPEKNAIVNYNLGNCAYKLEKYGYALLYWRRAERGFGIFDRGELLDNIFLLKRKLGRRSEPQSKLIRYYSRLKNYTLSLLRSAPLFVVQILFLILWLFLFLYLRFLYKRKRKILIVILFLLIAILGALLVLRYRLEFRRYGVIVKKKVTLLSGPGRNFQELGGLPEASEVWIQKSSDGFYKIKFNKQIGWVNQRDIERI